MRIALVTLLALSIPAQPASFDRDFEHLKATLSPEDLYRLLWEMPKGGDLHHHFEYSFPMHLWYEGARDHGYFSRTKIGNCKDIDPLLYTTIPEPAYRSLPTCLQADYEPLSRINEKTWISAVTLDQPSDGRDKFFDHITRRLEFLEKDPHLMADLFPKIQRLAAEEHILYLETQADPRGVRNMTADQGADLIRKQLAKPNPVVVRCQVSVVRFNPNAISQIEEAYAFVSRNRDLWVGVNLVGREETEGGKPDRFLRTFRELRRHYFDVPLSLHAGETDQPGHDVRDTLLLGATRIGHGTNLITDPATMLLLRGGRTLIEVSLVSNLLLGYVPDIAKHPFPEYLRFGIPVCLNTDDAGAFDSNLTDEYFLAVRNFNLSWPEIRQIGRASLEFSFAEPSVKQALLARYDHALAAFEARFSGAQASARLAAVHPRLSGFARRRLLL